MNAGGGGGGCLMWSLLTPLAGWFVSCPAGKASGRCRAGTRAVLMALVPCHGPVGRDAAEDVGLLGAVVAYATRRRDDIYIQTVTIQAITRVRP